MNVVDLPGTYSLSATSPDQVVTREVVLGQRDSEPLPDVILCVVDATNLKLHLRLVLELKQLGRPMLIALNMIDLATRDKIDIDVDALESALGIPVIPTVAVRRSGVKELSVELSNHLNDLVEEAAKTKPLPAWQPQDLKSLQKEAGRIAKVATRSEGIEHVMTRRLDALFLHKIAGPVILFAMLFVMFQAVFAWAETPMEWIDMGIGALADWLIASLPDNALRSLLVDGVIAGVGSVVVAITYLSLIVGELVPKQLALRAADRIAMVMAGPMKWLATIAAPVVWLLDTSSATIVRLFGVRPGGQNSVTAEELQMLFAEATRSGVLEAEQSAILKGVVRLADRPVREVMTPRTELDWIDADADRDEIEQTFADSPHSLMPVAEGSPDRIIGVVKVREVLAAMVSGETFALTDKVKRVEVVPDQLDAMDALRVLQQADVAMAMVHDEYGHLDGIVTPIDLLTAIVGQFESDKDQGEIPEVIERADGSMLVSGSLSAEDLGDRLALDYGEERDFATAAGFALSVLKHLPEEGELFTHQGWQFEIVDMDGRKIDKLLVQEIEPVGEPASKDG